MLKLKLHGTDPVLYLAGFKENKKAIATLSGYLEKEGIDYNIIPIFIKKNFLSEIEENSLVAISFLSTRWLQVKKLIRPLREKNAFLIAGGPHPDGRYRELLEEDYFDLIFRGEGEESFKKFILFLKGKIELSEIPGICYKENNNIKCNPQDLSIDLDSSPGYSKKYRIFPSIEVTRGCPFLCQYCQTPALFGRKPRYRSIENTLEIVNLYLKVGHRDFRFITPNAFGYLDPAPREETSFRALILSLYKKIEGRGRIFIGSFPSEVRPDYVTPGKVELIKEYCANDNLVMGAQSGSEKILKEMKRGHSIDDILNATEIIISHGLIANVDLIFGNPDEEQEDIEATIELIYKLLEMGARIHGHYFMPLPGTPWENEKPVKWPQKYIKILGTLTREGKLYGSWTEQMRFLEKLGE